MSEQEKRWREFRIAIEPELAAKRVQESPLEERRRERVTRFKAKRRRGLWYQNV